MSRLDLKRILMGGTVVLSSGLLLLASSSEEFPNEDAAYWFFEPIAQPAVPEVRDGQWVRNPIDAFILARL